MVRNSIFIFCLCLLFEYQICGALNSSLLSYNKQITSWLVHLYDFYYSLVLKDRCTHSFVKNPSELVCTYQLWIAKYLYISGVNRQNTFISGIYSQSTNVRGAPEKRGTIKKFVMYSLQILYHFE